MNSKSFGLGILDAIVKIVVVIIAIMLISKYAKVGYEFGYNIFNQTPVTTAGEGKTVRLTIDSSVTVTELAKQLEEVGLISDWKLFYIQEYLSNYHGKITSGTYELSSTMTADEMLEILASGYTEEEEILVNSETEVTTDSTDAASETSEEVSETGETTEGNN
ncbi:MAG: endolytic transglycosylase MltG [Butyrivibrio sp.]|nr:endolytic transglycosylase MltG [Butyrivibrio sp.]